MCPKGYLVHPNHYNVYWGGVTLMGTPVKGTCSVALESRVPT